MNNTLAELNAMRTNSLKSVLQDLYATAGTASSGNTNNATNGSDDYDSHVSIVYEEDNTNATSWNNERTWAALSDNDVNDFLTNGHNDFPSDADNVVFLLFQDEANVAYHDTTFSDAESRTSTHNTDVASLTSRINTLNSSNNNFYRAVVFNVKQNGGVTNFKSYLTAVSTGTGQYTGSNGLSTLFSNNTLGVVYDLEDSDNNDSNAPYKPGSTTDRFDKWEYYYLYHVTNELRNLGFDNSGSLGWPVIKDDG